MSNFPDAHKVYDLAATFRERVIEQGRSFLWPDQEIWTDENIESLMDFETNLFDQSGDQSIPQTADAVGQTSPELTMMAADAQAACHLFWASTVETMQRLVSAFTNKPGVPEVDKETWSLLEEQAPLEVPASWTTYKQTNLTWHLTALSTIATLRITRDEPRDVSNMEKSLLEIGRPGIWYHHVWCIAHVLYPEQIPPLPAEDPRKLVINRFATEAGANPDAGEMTQMQTIREYLRPRVGEDIFDYYHPSIYLDWENRKGQINKWVRYERGGSIPEDVVSRVETILATSTSEPTSATQDILSKSHIIQDRAPVYEIARLFRELIVEQGASLLWPADDLWTDAAIEQFLRDFQEMPVIKGNSWLQNYEAQLGDGNQDSAKILADSYAFLMQFPSTDKLTAATKSKDLQRILSWTHRSLPDQAALTSVEGAFGLGIGAPGQYFSAHVPYQLAFVPAFVREHRRNPDMGLLEVVNTTAEKLKNEYGFKRSVVPSQNIVLHLLDPANFERIASRADKSRIVEGFTALIDIPETYIDDGLDSQLRVIRSHLAKEHFPRNFDFYDSNVQPFWNSETPPPWPPKSLDSSGGIEPAEQAFTPPTITDLASNTFLDESFLRDIETLLTTKQQLIFEGPPGSGKTYVAEQFARYFTGQSLDTNKTNNQIELVQFHQSYSYEDFVEGIRPRMDGGQLIYTVEAGIFLRMVARAADHPKQNYVLIIDEINRGNVSRILGELMLLLEYRDKSATLPYSKDQLQIPPNLYIIGTMNTADRSLSQIDYALRRRFYFVRFMSVENNEARVLDGWLRQQQLDAATHSTILQSFITLNQQLETDLGTDDLQVGHSYFMDKNIHNERQQQHIWTYAVLPLIREYLYHHRERDSLLKNYQLDRIIRFAEPAIDDQVESETSADLEETPE